jgi:hypothetical protein
MFRHNDEGGEHGTAVAAAPFSGYRIAAALPAAAYLVGVCR